MKKNLLILLVIGLFGTAQAQDFSLSADSFVKDFTMTEGENRDEVVYSLFTHNLSGERTFVWERIEDYLSTGWETAVCDRNRCYLTTVSSQSFTVGPGIESTMDLHCYTNSITGDSAVVTIKIYEEGNPDVFITQKYTCRNLGITAAEDLAFDAIQIFPNPTSEFFRIENENFSVKNLHVYNITGKLVARYETMDHNEYDVSTLPKGAYFVKLNGENKTLKTLRLNII